MPSSVSLSLVSEIKSLHNDITESARTSLTKAIRVGELLSKAHDQINHGGWGDWVESTLPFSGRTATRYIAVFENRTKFKADTVFELSKAYAAIKDSEPTKPKPKPKSDTLSETSVDNQSDAEEEADEEELPSPAPKPKPKEPIELDETGYPIPKESVKFWNRREEVQELMTAVTRIKGAINKALSANDPMFGRVSNTVIADLTNAYTHLADAKPYAVCTECAGRPSIQPKGCGFCGNSGLISKYRWDTCSRKEIKAIRAKSIAA
jgi:hypothetical protein